MIQMMNSEQIFFINVFYFLLKLLYIRFGIRNKRCSNSNNRAFFHVLKLFDKIHRSIKSLICRSEPHPNGKLQKL